MTKKGFTLIEMIVVIVLISVVLLTAIPRVIKIMTAQNNEKYEAHMKLVKQALDIYTISYKGEFDNYPDANIYRINYDALDELMVADDIECSGYIDMTKKKGNSYKYDYYLRCVDNPLDPSKTPYIDTVSDKPTCNNANKCVEIAY